MVPAAYFAVGAMAFLVLMTLCLDGSLAIAFTCSPSHRSSFPSSTPVVYATIVLAVALSYLHVGGRTPTDL
jgi:hypothetical protein